MRAFHPGRNDCVLEIGPGLGALTQPLLRHLNNLIAIEIDTHLIEHLHSLPDAATKLHLHQADALTVDYHQWGNHLRLIGNLPYNISTPLLLHLLQYTSSIDDMLFMLQKEVVERLAAQPGCKAYGRLSVVVQYLCEVEMLFTVPPTAFHPQPKVDSAIIRLTPYKISPYQTVAFAALEALVAKAFSMRRKTLANNLKPLLSVAQLEILSIDPTRRPEQLSVTDYVRIVEFITN